jgi:hypothetical protein
MTDLIAASGVRSSCDTFAAKSRRTCSVRFTSEMSCSTTSVSQSPPMIGVMNTWRY